MIGTLQCVVLDCPDPLGLARFYQAMLGGEVNQADARWGTGDDFSTLHTGSGRPSLLPAPGKTRAITFGEPCAGIE